MPDNQLVQLMAEGDREACAELRDRHGLSVYAQLYVALGRARQPSGSCQRRSIRPGAPPGSSIPAPAAARVAVVAGAIARRRRRRHPGRAMTRRRMTRVVGAGPRVGHGRGGWLALFTWDPTPTWARWTLGAGVTLTILAGFLRQPAG